MFYLIGKRPQIFTTNYSEILSTDQFTLAGFPLGRISGKEPNFCSNTILAESASLSRQ